MKSIKQIAFTVLLTIGAFSAVTYTSCNKDACKDVTCQNGGTCNNGTCTCPTGTEGNNCETVVRTVYSNTYRGTGADNIGGTYAEWALIFSPTSSTDITQMNLQIVDANNAPQLAFVVTLTSATTFTVNNKTNGNFSYSGSGTISTTTAALSLTETSTAGGTPTIYTFTNMNKQ